MNDQNGYCRTLKQQYAKTAIQNLQSKGTFGATGVIQWKSSMWDEFSPLLVSNIKIKK